MTSVDVIILSWDRLNDTIAAIASALAQEFVDLKIIVVDQGSKPENLLKLKEFCATDHRITLICNTINTGVTGGRNQASFAGHGKYIVALDNDAEFADSQQLIKAVSLLDQRPELGILAFRIKCFAEDADDLTSWAYSDNPKDETTTIFKTTRYVGAGHAIRRNVFEQVGGYDEHLFFMHEEVDLAKRFINAGYEIEYNPSVIIRHKVSNEHRVSWTGKRFYYDVRNRTYLHFKHKTFFPTLVFHTFLLMIKGFKLGYKLAAIQGLFASFLLLPAAVHARFADSYVRENEKAKAYHQLCNPFSTRPLMERITYRIRSVLK